MVTGRIIRVMMVTVLAAAVIAAADGPGRIAQAADAAPLGQQLEQARQALARTLDVDGAAWDEKTGRVVLFVRSGKGEIGLSPINVDDFIVIMKTIAQGRNPGVSIEPGPTPTHQIVRYLPEGVKNTHLGSTLFEADRLLKGLGFGKDPVDGSPVSSSVYGYHNMVELTAQSKTLSEGDFGRLWCKPRRVVVKESGSVMLISQVTMGTESESEYASAVEFARHFEDNFEKFADEYPIYQEVIRIAKLVAVARWLNDRGRLGGAKLESYRLGELDTPATTKTVKALIREETTPEGKVPYYLFGGMLMDAANTYETSASATLDGVPLADVLKAMVEARTDAGAITWEFRLKGSPYRATSLLLPR